MSRACARDRRCTRRFTRLPDFAGFRFMAQASSEASAAAMGTAPQIEPARVVRCLLPQRPAAAAARLSASRRRPSSCHVHEPSRGRNRAQGLNYARTCLRQHVANDPRSRRCDTTRAEGVQAAERRVLVGESVLHREPPRCIRLSLRFASGAVRRQSSTDHAGQHIQCHARPAKGTENRRLATCPG
jgi:hypothetical protein